MVAWPSQAGFGLVGEDQPIVREGIVHVLQDSGFEVVGTTADARNLVRKARAERPDVVITDIQMPPDHADDGLRAALEIRRPSPAWACWFCPSIWRTITRSTWSPRRAGCGLPAEGKVGRPARVHRRRSPGRRRRISARSFNVVARLVGRRRRSSSLDRLSKRESEVLALIAEGLSNAGVAEKLVVTVAKP